MLKLFKNVKEVVKGRANKLENVRKFTKIIGGTGRIGKAFEMISDD